MHKTKMLHVDIFRL
ncbi:TPA: DUF1196 domain-containing protein [Vibrio cholerae]|nr:DUF1196 domain-containing protein [Vibrio cholerae]MVB52239.1 DUF1196 domain-containing protein [Vibrio cholerae]NOF61567.1 DUF1196 domain-containing protein [Vibrio cholerae]HAS4517509.1 DUF1196 domain-containing protein [Vibrio cholerae]HAS4539767.1 DUF1196 domain-containing protein [Vibrio cholerae]